MFGQSKRTEKYLSIATENEKTSDSDTEECSECCTRGHRKGEGWLQWMRTNFLKVAQLLILLDISILLTIDVTATLAARTRRSRICNTRAQEPVPDFLDYSIKFKNSFEWGEYEEPWNLPPSDELDAAWDQLVFAKNIRVTAQEMHSMGANTTHRVRISGGDYVGVLGPYHQLHCMNILRRVIHWDYYGPRMTEEERQSYIYTQHHSDHCIELFRQSAICHAYPTLYTGEWIADSHAFNSIELRHEGKAKCVDWNSLDTWARERVLTPGYKQRPGPFEKLNKTRT